MLRESYMASMALARAYVATSQARLQHLQQVAEEKVREQMSLEGAGSRSADADPSISSRVLDSDRVEVDVVIPPERRGTGLTGAFRRFLYIASTAEVRPLLGWVR